LCGEQREKISARADLPRLEGCAQRIATREADALRDVVGFDTSYVYGEEVWTRYGTDRPAISGSINGGVRAVDDDDVESSLVALGSYGPRG
jgi:hypothetical protein